LVKSKLGAVLLITARRFNVVYVTGAAIRLIVPVASKERVPVASRYGAIFAIMRAGCFAIAVQGDS